MKYMTFFSHKDWKRRQTLKPNADKQEMRNYLLGTLDSDRKKQLEQRILSVPEVYEELAIVEEELIDQYVAGGLSKLERQQFETHFPITAERQKNLRFGQLLKRYFNSHPLHDAEQDFAAAAIPHVENSAPAKNPSVFSLSPVGARPLITFCVAGVAMVGIVLLGWLGYRRPPARSVQQSTQPVVVVTLAPGSVTTEGAPAPRVNVPPKGYNLKLELELPRSSFRNYKSELFRGNKSVETKGELKIEAKGQQYVVPLTITGEMLSPGDYEVKLSGVLDSGADEFVEKYSFRVIE
jgi:hypothetical protein